MKIVLETNTVQNWMWYLCMSLQLGPNGLSFSIQIVSTNTICKKLQDLNLFKFNLKEFKFRNHNCVSGPKTKGLKGYSWWKSSQIQMVKLALIFWWRCDSFIWIVWQIDNDGMANNRWMAGNCYILITDCTLIY